MTLHIKAIKLLIKTPGGSIDLLGATIILVLLAMDQDLQMIVRLINHLILRRSIYKNRPHLSILKSRQRLTCKDKLIKLLISYLLIRGRDNRLMRLYRVKMLLTGWIKIKACQVTLQFEETQLMGLTKGLSLSLQRFCCLSVSWTNH